MQFLLDVYQSLKQKAIPVNATIAFIMLAITTNAQTIQGKVLDSTNDEPLIYCHIKFIGADGGTLSNGDGEFEIANTASVDSVRVSYIGYKAQTLALGELRDTKVIRLDPQSIELGEISILGEDEYLYKAMSKCRKVMQRQPAQTSKAYFHLETLTRDVPMEMMQCYYNATTKGCRVTDLQLKNARAGLPKFEGGGYFVSLNTTRAIAKLDLTDLDDDFPLNPLQLSKSKCKEEFDLVRLPSFSDENTLHIAFTPKNERGIHFVAPKTPKPQNPSLFISALKLNQRYYSKQHCHQLYSKNRP